MLNPFELKYPAMGLALALSCLTYPSHGLDPRLVKSSSIPVPNQLATRASKDGCPNVQPLEGSPDAVFFVNGSPTGCPIIHKPDKNGACTDHLNTQGSISQCASYCEEKVQFYYGPESVFTQFGQCRKDEPCSFTTSESKTITMTVGFSLGTGLKARSVEGGAVIAKRADEALLKPTFNLGATFDYSVSSTIAKGLVLSRPTKDVEQCGHWTFVPIIWKSCGVMSTSAFTPELAECDTTAQTLKTQKDYCNDTPYLDSSGNQAGETIFVLVDCDSNLLLPMEKQDPIYRRPGVCATCA